MHPEIPVELKDPPRPPGYDLEWPLAVQPWRPFDENGHEKIGPRWGDSTWRGMTFFLVIAIVFILVLFTFGPLHSWS